MPTGLNAAHAIELRAAAGVPRVSCCLSTISSPSLLCGFALLPPPLSSTSLELWRPCPEAAACRDSLLPFLPLLWACLGLLCHTSQAHFLCFLHERMIACLCVCYTYCTRTTSRVTSVAQHLGSCWVTWTYKRAPLLFIWKLIHRKGGGS